VEARLGSCSSKSSS